MFFRSRRHDRLARRNSPAAAPAKHRGSVFETLESRQLMAATDLDVSFSGDGKLVTDFGGADDVAQAVAVQSDGKIVVAGQTQLTVNGVKKIAFAAIRYNKDGSLDDGTSKDTTPGDKFGSAGKFTRVVAQGGGTGAVAAVIQKDGKIILGGNAVQSAAAGTQWQILRLNKDGSLDSSYGSGGTRATTFQLGDNPRFTSMALQPDGKLVIAGGNEGDWVVKRLTTSGQFETSFGGNGQRSFDFGGGATGQIATSVAIDSSGRIVVAGNGIAGQVAVVRLFGSGGDNDGSFGTMGRTTYLTGAITGNVGAVAALPNGEIQLAYAGRYPDKMLTGVLPPVPGTIPGAGTIAFSENGTHTDDNVRGSRTGATGLVNTPVDFFAVGGTYQVAGGPENFFIADARSDESKQVGFGSSTDRNVATAMAVGPDGKIVQVGYTTSGGGQRNFAIARYVGTPTSNLATVSGTAFYDFDTDGVRDANEGFLNGVRVYVDNNKNGVFEPTERSVLTSNEGKYSFRLPAGNHAIRVEPSFLFSTTYPVNPFGVYNVNLAAKQSVSGRDFGLGIFSVGRQATEIVGSVFFDFDGDGLRDVQSPRTEPDVVGRTVFLDNNGNGVLDTGERQTKTDGGGNYKFDNLTPGNYRVGSVLPSGWTHTDPVGGFHEVFVGAGQTITRRFATTFADPDDTITEVNSRPGNQIAVGGSVNFSIGDVTDVDFIRFTVKKGQKVGFDVDRASGSSLNSYLRLFDQFGNQLATNDDAAGPGESKASDSYVSHTFNTAGTYYIAVSNNQNKTYEPRFGYDDNGAGSTGAYKLSLLKLN